MDYLVAQTSYFQMETTDSSRRRRRKAIRTLNKLCFYLVGVSVAFLVWMMRPFSTISLVDVTQTLTSSARTEKSSALMKQTSWCSSERSLRSPVDFFRSASSPEKELVDLPVFWKCPHRSVVSSFELTRWLLRK